MIGCMFDADARRISFSYNGADLGAAFENVPVVAGGYAPAVTVAPGCAFAFNFGAMPMKHWPGPQYTMLEQLPVCVSVRFCRCNMRASFLSSSLIYFSGSLLLSEIKSKPREVKK